MDIFIILGAIFIVLLVMSAIYYYRLRHDHSTVYDFDYNLLFMQLELTLFAILSIISVILWYYTNDKLNY